MHNTDPTSIIGLRTQILENHHYLHPDLANVMLVTSSYSNLHGAHIVERPDDGGKRLMSSSFRTTSEKALRELLDKLEGEVYRRLYGYGGLKVREGGK